MIEYNEAENKMILKLVYYGPAMSGKTTNLLCLHDILDTTGRGELMMLDTKEDRTIFFDLLPFFFTAPGGLKIKLKVYTVPGQVRHDATRKAVLTRADGIAFIADSQVSESANNAESFGNLEKNLTFVGIDIDRVPLVIQFNKRDLQEITPEEELRKVWKSSGIQLFMASALQGWGILETFTSLLGMTYDSLDGRYGLAGKQGLTKDMFVKNLTRQEANGQNVR
ncbi:MAG: GTPase [Nitrospirae bacterium]|nr:MAG: GTPase [Nitrospirota bacterium]